MLKSNELRVGNWIEAYPGGPVQVVSLGTDVVNGIIHTPNFVGATHGGILSPIPLTTEILHNCGFKKGEKWYIHQVYYNGIIDICHTRGCFTYGRKTEYGFDSTIDIESLHQLQNLYFALIGKELTLNLPLSTPYIPQ